MFRRSLLQLAFLCVLVAAVGSPAFAQLLNGSTNPSKPQAPPTDGDGLNVPPDAVEKIPRQTAILVKGAEPSASDSSTPLPEDGAVTKNIYQNRYFGITYPFPPVWAEPFSGPPPSDSGQYVLAQLTPDTKSPVKGTVLITAQDMFFTPTPTHNALELVKFSKEHLPDYYEVERAPTELKIAGHNFVRFDYKSPVAGLHWYVLATQIRCHAIQFVFTSQDTKLLESLIDDMNRIQLPDDANVTAGKGGGPTPVCMPGYVTAAHIVNKVDPVITDNRFNQIPVRIVIDKKGKVRHVHLLSAFPDQSAAITEALMQWTFEPLVRDGKPLEVETGILFRARTSEAPKSTSVND
jgi:hypothetical protein